MDKVFEAEQQQNFNLEPDLERRVGNLALGPKTPTNALVPIYEAIYNSIHAAEDRFGSEWPTKIRLVVDFHNFESNSPSIEIRDNGIGLNEENFRSFRTYDSALKKGRGGKGVGRLSWLKVFGHAEIDSRFFSEGKVIRRKFRLELDNSLPIRGHETTQVDSTDLETSITLRNMRSEYALHMPTKVETILRKLIAHFLPFFLAEEKPSVVIQTASEIYDLAKFLETKQKTIGRNQMSMPNGDSIDIEHNLLERGVVEGTANHKLYFAANGRIVSEVDIGLALGLTTYIERNGSRYSYAGVVSGDILNQNVNSERTAFDLDPNQIETLKRKTLENVREVLAPQINRVISQQAEITRSVVKKYPRFSYLVENPHTFVEQKVPRNYRTAEQIYQQLSIFDFRENRELEKKVEAASKIAEFSSDTTVQAGVDEILGRLTSQEFSVLADYTVRRKVLLDLLDKRLGYKPDGSMKHFAEEALHKFVVPMRVASHDIHIDKHNLWIVDDKLTYYEHWASDKSMKKTVENISSTERPDVLLFGGRTAFHRPGTDQPVVIIEFKKPARDDYNDDENPFTQIYSYIEDLKGGRAADRNGAVVQEVTENTPFFCYIIADITPKLRTWLRMAQIKVPLPGGGGFYGYNDDYKAFIQVLSYKYVLKDARLRNEAFFKHLSI